MVGEFAYFQGLCKWGICKNSLWYSKIALDTLLTEIGQTSFVPNQCTIDPWIATYQVLAWRMRGILVGIHTLNLKNLLCQCESKGQHGALKESLVSMWVVQISPCNWELWFKMSWKANHSRNGRSAVNAFIAGDWGFSCAMLNPVVTYEPRDSATFSFQTNAEHLFSQADQNCFDWDFWNVGLPKEEMTMQV